MLVTWIALVLRDRYFCNNMLVDYLHCVKEVSLTLDDLAFEAGLVMRFSCDSYPTSLTSTTSVFIILAMTSRRLRGVGFLEEGRPSMDDTL